MTTKATIRNIDPDLMWEVKILAARTKQTMGEIVTEALERLLDADAEEQECASDDAVLHGE